MSKRFYDAVVADAADAVIAAAIHDLLRGEPSIMIGESKHHVVVVAAPAGAGKSYFCGTVVEELCAAHPRVGALALVCSPTNDQAWDLAANLARRLPHERIALMPASSKTPPEALTTLPNVEVVKAEDAAGERIVVATLDKTADAHGRGSLTAHFKYLLMDEAYQGSSAQYYCVAALADRHLLVGDPGQIMPFTTMPDPDRWRGLLEDPVSSAVTVLLRHHPRVPYRLPITRRLPPSAVPVCASFYPDHRFGAWVTESARRLELAAGHKRGHRAVIDQVADLAASTGWAWVRLPERAVLSADPDSIQVIADVVTGLLDRSPNVSCERVPKAGPLQHDRIAISVSHNDQKDLLRVHFDDLGLADVRIDTANKLQGLEFDLTVAWHPLAGLSETDRFHLEPGRMCVMTTRHRHACIVVGRKSDADLLDGVPPAADAWGDGEMDPEVEGWFAHRATFDQLERVAVDIV
ncbi:MAG: hypothetical protein ACOYXM_17705 [Actinomycetota bacterium]